MQTNRVNVDFGRTSWTAGLLSLLLVVAWTIGGCIGVTTEMSPPPIMTQAVQPEASATPAAEVESPEVPEDQAVASAGNRLDSAAGPEIIRLDHIHGLGWDPDGTVLTVATHTGLRLFEENHWVEPVGPAHDYSALVRTADGFYAAGSPAPGTLESDPLGLVKSTDQGQSLELLSFAGESEIHFLGAGYETNAVYVVIDAENSLVPPGLHYTLDDGAHWQASAAQGVNFVTIQLAAHPTDPAIIAFGTEGGVLLSTDSGNSFTRVTDNTPLSAVTFSPAEEGVLYYGLRTLMRLEPDGGDAKALNMPDLNPQDAMIAIAINPSDPNEIAIATFDAYLWHTEDGGATWQLIGDPYAAR